MSIIIPAVLFSLICSPVRQSEPPTVVPTRRDVAFDKSLIGTWDVATQGPLLVVDPGDYSRFLAFTSIGMSYNENEADHTPRLLRRVGGISTVIPKYIYSVNGNARINPFASLTRPEMWQLLEASLGDAQISALCRQEGLAASSLDGQQRQMFDLLLPDPLRVRELKGSSAKLYGEAAGEVSVKEADRGAIRIKMSLSSNAYLPTTTPVAAGVSDVGVFVGFRTPLVNSEGTFGKYRVVDDATQASLFLKSVANREKPGDLSYDASPLRATLSMPGTETVAELLARVSEQAGIVIKADARVGKLRTVFRGDSAVCTDLLQALAMSVGGTYRRLPGATNGYLLCHDRQGEAASKFPVWAWYLTNRAERREYLASRLSQLSDGRFADHLRFGPDELFPLDDIARSQVFQKARDGQRPVVVFPVSQLPAAGRELARQTAANFQEYRSTLTGGSRPDAIKEGTISIAVGAKVTLDVPGIGSVDDPAASQTLRRFLPAPPLIAGAIDRAALEQHSAVCYALSPEEDFGLLAERREALPAADAKAPLFLDVTLILNMPAPGAKEVSGKVSALLAGLATRGVPVYLVCSLYGEPVKPGSLRPPVAVPTGSSTPLAPVPSGGVPDVNVLGMDNIAWETWYSRNVMREAGARVATYHPRTRWLAGRDTGDFLARLSELAQPDSVTAVVLTDVAPNGYASPLPEARPGLTVASGGFIGTDFGYTEAARAAFIEKYVCHPLDLIPVPLAGSAMTPHIPFFPDDVSLSRQWAEFRATKRAAEVAPLVAAIQKMG